MVESNGDLKSILGEGFEVYCLDQHVLLAFFIWLNSWLEHAGPRNPIIASDLPKDYIFWKEI
jgi:hypothetical protein